ncbi:hypothetical protein JCM5296_004804 [Sporobolomyces johnsonii]
MPSRTKKLLPSFVGLFACSAYDPATSTYTLDLPERYTRRGIKRNYHAGVLRRHIESPEDLFPHRVTNSVPIFPLEDVGQAPTAPNSTAAVSTAPAEPLQASYPDETPFLTLDPDVREDRDTSFRTTNPHAVVLDGVTRWKAFRDNKKRIYYKKDDTGYPALPDKPALHTHEIPPVHRRRHSIVDTEAQSDEEMHDDSMPATAPKPAFAEPHYPDAPAEDGGAVHGTPATDPHNGYLRIGNNRVPAEHVSRWFGAQPPTQKTINDFFATHRYNAVTGHKRVNDLLRIFCTGLEGRRLVAQHWLVADKEVDQEVYCLGRSVSVSVRKIPSPESYNIPGSFHQLRPGKAIALHGPERDAEGRWQRTTLTVDCLSSHEDYIAFLNHRQAIRFWRRKQGKESILDLEGCGVRRNQCERAQHGRRRSASPRVGPSQLHSAGEQWLLDHQTDLLDTLLMASRRYINDGNASTSTSRNPCRDYDDDVRSTRSSRRYDDPDEDSRSSRGSYRCGY